MTTQIRKPKNDEITLERYRAQGEKAAAYLEENPEAWPHQTAKYLGISVRTLQLWTSSNEPAYEAFQDAYLPALHAQAKHALEQAEQRISVREEMRVSGPRVSWESWKLAKVHPKFFGDSKEPSVTINNTNAQQTNVNADGNSVLEDLKREAEVNPELRAALKEALGE